MSGFRLAPDVRPARYELRFELDLDAWRFRGRERCEMFLQVERSDVVVHAVDLELTGVVIQARDLTVRPRLEPDPDNGTVRLISPERLPAGPCVLELDLAGAIRDDLKALYRSTRGDERYAITTLWPAESRRLYACFDEPPFKSHFALELVTANDLAAIANARLLERRTMDDGRLLWRFAETPPLSPYLLAFAVGPFAATEPVLTRSGIPVRVWVPRGLEGSATYARDAQRDCIDHLEEYTAVAYPYDKVEGVGVADFAAGAMENPGAVTYRLELVTADPRTASARALKGTVGVAAHELTHMWWGDLATLAWWDDLWLSESFATFVGNKTENALHPEWMIWRDFVSGMTAGFRLDALASTHGIHAPAESAAAALQRVDAITYQKGAAVLRMLETYLGEDVFRDGVRLYLGRYGGSCATASDFWSALDEASGQDVTAIAKAWITEPGHPMVELRLDGGRMHMRQSRFFADPDAPASPQRWPIPVVLRTAGGETRTLLRETEDSVAIADGGWIFPNARAAGFYRFSLDPELRARLLLHLHELTPEERLLLLDNEWALAHAGRSAAAGYVALLRSLAGESDRAVLQTALDQLRWLSIHAVTGHAARPFASLVESVFRPVFDRLGMEPRAGEDEDDQELRATAIRALGETAGSTAVRRDAAERIRRHLDGDTQDRNLIAAFAAVAAIEGDVSLHARYLDRVRTGGPQEIARFRPALPVFRDGAATRETLARVDDRTIRDQDLRDVFWWGFRNGAQRRTYWRAFTDRYPTRIAPLEAMVLTGVLASVQQLTSPDLAREADAFLASVASASTAEIIPRIRETLRLESEAAQRIGSQLAEALA